MENNNKIQIEQIKQFLEKYNFVKEYITTHKVGLLNVLIKSAELHLETVCEMCEREGIPQDERTKIIQEATATLEDAKAALENLKKGL